ncbi:MAG TPA: S8 family serine peptidase, partial [Mycobacteriales bacterium]|nr:S8 family serine peptidase [Mycobacteriales bacterium]
MTYRQNTSWGGRAHNTSWGGRAVRSMALLAGLTVTFPIASAALPAVAQASEHVVVVGPDAARAALAVGAIDTRTLVPGVATAQVSPAGAAALAGRGLRVAANSRVQLDSALSFSEGGDASGSQGDNPSDANAWGDSTAGDSRRHDPTASPDGRLSVHTITRAGEIGSGAGETIAVIDSGVDEVPGLAGRVIQGIDLTGSGPQDAYGHGTFVASLAAGDGTGADGRHTGIVGVAPAARILSVKVADSQGRSTVGQVVAGLAWVIAHRDTFGIDVVNLSLSVKKASSYNSDPVDALAEAAWFSGIVVVASSGNDGGNVDSAPGNDPFVLTVGSSYDANTVTPADDTLSPYSNAGVTQDGVSKPEVTVTGEHVQAALP